MMIGNAVIIMALVEIIAKMESARIVWRPVKTVQSLALIAVREVVPVSPVNASNLSYFTLRPWRSVL